jgi:hypothetical protein
MKSLCRASSLGSPHRTERPVRQAPWLVLGIPQTTLGRRVLQDHDQRRGGHRDSRRGHLRGRSRTSESKAAGSKDPALPPRLLQPIGPTRSREREAFSACDIAVQNDTTTTNTGTVHQQPRGDKGYHPRREPGRGQPTRALRNRRGDRVHGEIKNLEFPNLECRTRIPDSNFSIPNFATRFK